MSPIATTLTLSALMGAATAVSVLALACRVQTRSLAKVEQPGRVILLPLLGLGTLCVLAIRYEPWHVALLLICIGSVAAGLALYAAVPPRGRAAWHHAAALTLVGGVVASEGVLASTAAGGWWAQHPSACAAIAGRRAVPVLVAVINRQPPSWPAIQEAAAALLRVSDPSDVHVNLVALASGEYAVAEEATQRLILQSSRAVPALIDALEGPHLYQGEPAKRALVRVEEVAVPALADAAASSDRSIDLRRRAVEALAEIGDFRGVPALTTVLLQNSMPPGVRLKAARALGILGDRSTLPALVAVLLDASREVEVREVAAHSLGRVARRTVDRREPLRAEVVSILLTSLRAPELRVRNGAAMGLGEIGLDVAPTLIAALGQRLRRPGNDLDEGDWIAWALGMMGSRDAAPVLRAADRRSHYALRCVFCEALRRVDARLVPSAGAR